jgi:hypothetical protein
LLGPLVLALGLGLASLLAARPARGTVMVEVPLGEMVATADLVVRGTVVRTGTRVAIVDGALVPRTHTWLRVSERLRGERGAAAGALVEVVEAGGRWGAAAAGGEGFEETAGAPRYVAGEEVVVFLVAERGADGKAVRYRTHQMAQGKYRVVRLAREEPQALRELDDVAFLSWNADAHPSMSLPARAELQAAPSSRRPLGAFLDEIRRLAAAGTPVAPPDGKGLYRPEGQR